MNLDISRTINKDIAEQIQRANEEKRPFYFLVAATRPCFVKLASLVRVLEQRKIPHLLLTSGQHWDVELSRPIEELNYGHRISLSLDAAGPMLARQAALSKGLLKLSDLLASHKLEQPAVPMVSGDTWSAGFLPANWLMHTATKSVHIEAGLRSEGPSWEDAPFGRGRMAWQRETTWQIYRDVPFPEGTCTRLATIASQTLFAPTRRNAAHLMNECWNEELVRVVGSLSADAVQECCMNKAGMKEALDELFEEHPQLSEGEWLRVDIHRRENMRADRIAALLATLSSISKAGVNVVLVETNAFKTAVKQFQLGGQLQQAIKAGILVTQMWKRYFSVLAFMQSAQCRCIYTDSGGLQEEAHVLGVPCLTARWSTDRAETIIEARSNLLVPLDDSKQMHDTILAYLNEQAGKQRQAGTLYSENVAERIVAEMLSLEDANIEYQVLGCMVDWVSCANH